MALLPQASPLSLPECRRIAELLLRNPPTRMCCGWQPHRGHMWKPGGCCPPPPLPCGWQGQSFMQLSSPHTPPRVSAHSRDRGGVRQSRWPGLAQRWFPGEAVLLCMLGGGSWASLQVRGRTWRCFEEAFCGKARLFIFLCPPGAAWCAWP